MHPVPIPRSNEVKFRQRVWTMNIAGGLFKHNTTETYVGNAETAEPRNGRYGSAERVGARDIHIPDGSVKRAQGTIALYV